MANNTKLDKNDAMIIDTELSGRTPTPEEITERCHDLEKALDDFAASFNAFLSEVVPLLRGIGDADEK